jgi:hypothetical protein
MTTSGRGARNRAHEQGRWYLKFPAPAMTGKFCYVKRAP